MSPGVSVVLKGVRPDVAGDSLGAQLRRRRRELGLLRMEAAERMGVDPKTLMWWERDEKLPFVRAYPALITFLGYEPWEPPSTLAQALLAERRRHGLSTERASELVGVDPGTWLRWERGEWRMTRLTLPAVCQFLQLPVAQVFPDAVR